MNITVTGACGRIGSETLSQLVALGHAVTGFDLVPPRSPVPGVNYVTGSLLSAADIDRALQHADAVAHLAAHMSWSADDERSMMETNVVGTHALLQKSAQHGIKRFVFASSGEVYPENLPQYQPIDEKHPLEPASLYGETKKLGEELVRFFAQRRALPSVVLRFPHTQAASELLDPDSFFSGPRFFLQPKIKQQRAFKRDAVADMLSAHDTGTLRHLVQCDENGKSYAMHISDVRDTAAGVVLALTHPKAAGETFNLGTDEPVVFEQAVAKMARITGCDIVSVRMPGPPVRYHTDNRKIKTLLGYEPRFSFDAMLETAAEAWKRRKA